MSRFQFVEDHRATYEVKRLCELVEIERSSYYAWRAAVQFFDTTSTYFERDNEEAPTEQTPRVGCVATASPRTAEAICRRS